MTHPIKDLSASVLVVEPMLARRSMMTEGFRAIGFKTLLGAATLKDAIGVIAGEANPPDWIVTSLLPEAPINALQFLARLVETEALRACRVTLILQGDQRYCLSAAFALGLFSVHARFPDTQGQMAALTDVLPVGDDNDWDDCLIAAHYLRAHLRSQAAHAELERLEMRLLTLYPERGAQVTNLAEALVLSGNFGGAQLVLDRLADPPPKLARRAAELQAVLQAALLKSPADTGAFAEAMKIERAVVVDPDASARHVVVKVLQDLGVTAIDECADGEAAWALMRRTAKAPDLIIQEWRLPRLSGDMLVQRARLNGLATVPIIVYSSLVKPKDRLLLREMGVTEVLEKPLSAARLTASLMAILREEQRPTTAAGIERQLRACLANRDLAGARRLLGRLGSGRGGDLVRLALTAELEFQAANLPQAADLATQALAVGGEDVMVLNLLGKINLKLGQAAPAARFFARAQKLSPQNIGRLLFLADAHLVTNDVGAAEAALTQAKALDAGNLRVVEAEAKAALATGDVAAARGLIAKVGGTPGIAAFVNNRAVSLVSQGRTAESLDLYRTALTALPAKAKKVRAIVGYNLALALLRLGDVAGAGETLAATPTPADPGLAIKLRSLTARTTRALQTGEPVQLFLEGSGALVELGADEADEPAAPPVLAGALRCRMVYAEAAPDPRAAKLLATGAGYRAGKTIRKGPPR